MKQKLEKMVTQKRLLSQKKCLKWPNPSFEAWKWIPMFYSFCVAILECLWSMLVGEIELKCTKNFKGLNLNFIKYNGTVV